MNKTLARKIAETISNEQLQEMFNTAKERIKDWTVVSSVNKGMTKGTSWNILAKNFNVDDTHHILAKTNMIREFGEFLSEELKPSRKQKTDGLKPPIHQDPIL